MKPRFKFAGRCAAWHLLISLTVAVTTAALVFGLWYPMPYRALLGVAAMFWLILGVDAGCGPLLTLVVSNPRKALRERALDYGLIGAVQLAALIYGVHSVYTARPVVLAFEADRLVAITANEVQTDELADAPQGLQTLPWHGVTPVTTLRADNNEDFMTSVEFSLQGISPGMRPSQWKPWHAGVAAMKKRAKPLTELEARRPDQKHLLQEAAKHSGVPLADLSYLPLTSSKTLNWVALLDANFNMVGWAPVDGFHEQKTTKPKPAKPGKASG